MTELYSPIDLCDHVLIKAEGRRKKASVTGENIYLYTCNNAQTTEEDK